MLTARSGSPDWQRAVSMRSARPARALLVGLGALCIGILLWAHWTLSRTSVAHVRLAPATPAVQQVMLPIEADGDDVSLGVFIHSRSQPGFQFQMGGATLSGRVRDAATGRPVGGARVLLTLAPVAFSPASDLLTTHADGKGRFTIAHLADGRYMLAADRPFDPDHGPQYAQATLPFTVAGQSSISRDLALSPAATVRRAARGVRNMVVLELNGVYANTWLDDPAILAPTVRSLAATGTVATSVWADYGWPLADDDLLATGGYPGWRVFDPWPRLVTWGEQDGIDLAPWNPTQSNAGLPSTARWGEIWGQDSVFAVARRAGMATGWLGTPARQPLHLDPVTLSYVRTLGAADSWVAGMWAALDQLKRAPAGFLLYIDLAPPAAPQGEGQPSPAAPGGRYAQIVALFDAFVAEVVHALDAQGLQGSTDLLLTAGEAQTGYATADNYYGLGSSGRGTSLHIPFILHGPGVQAGLHWSGLVAADAVAPSVVALLGLPSPAGARAHALPFTVGR